MSAGIIRMPLFDEERLFDFIFKDVKPSCIYVETYDQIGNANYICSICIKNDCGVPDRLEVYSSISIDNGCIIVDRRALGKFNKQSCQTKRTRMTVGGFFLMNLMIKSK